MTTKLLIWGAGAVGQLVLDTVVRMNCFHEIAWIVDHLDSVVNSPMLYDLPVYGQRDAIARAAQEQWQIVIAIGDPRKRWQASQYLNKIEIPIATIIDPLAVISPRASIGKGSIVLPGAIVNTGAQLGEYVWLHNHSLVSHHVQVADFVSLLPGSRILENSHIETGVLIGAGAQVLGQSHIGQWSSISPASTVFQSADAYSLLAGNPARLMQKMTEYAVESKVQIVFNSELQYCLKSVWGCVPVLDDPNWKYGQVAEWDSLGHLRLISELEQTLSIHLQAEDIMQIRDMPSLIQILSKYGVKYAN